MSTIYGNILTFGSGGGGSSDVYAAIKVTYPSGSTCTATNGTKILTASDTSGTYIFGIPEPASIPETWTVSCTDGIDSASSTVSISTYGQVETVSLIYIPAIVNNATWAQISEISIAGTGDTYWDVGDCKAVTLNGKIGDYLTLSNTTLYVFILDFNHPINKTTADNNIIWGGFKTALNNSIDVALCDSGYGTIKTNGKYFNINHVEVTSTIENSNGGGWKGSDYRYDILGATSTAPSVYNSSSRSFGTNITGSNATASTISNPVSNTLLKSLPNDLRAVLRLWNRYIDYSGGHSTSDSYCSTVTIDAISLLAEFEIFGSQTWANPYEQTHQKQMAYYVQGNSKIKYKHNATGTACQWMTASLAQSDNMTHPNDAFWIWNVVNDSGSSYMGSTGKSYGLAPAFRT